MNEIKTVFDFIEATPPLRSITTMKRTSESKHQFHLLTRALQQRLNTKPTYITLEKQKGLLDRTKASIEEPSIFANITFSDGSRLFALEGFTKDWALQLKPPNRTYVVAEVEEGELQPTSYSPRRRRDALKVLITLLEQELHIKQALSLRALKKLDWSGLSRFEEYEALLRKAYLMQWDEDRIGKELQARERVNLLTATKRSDFAGILEILERRGPSSLLATLVESTVDLIHHRALKQLGFDEDRIQKEMGTSDGRRIELEEASKTLTPSEIHQMAERLVTFDPLVERYGATAVQLLFLNAPIRVRR